MLSAEDNIPTKKVGKGDTPYSSEVTRIFQKYDIYNIYSNKQTISLQQDYYNKNKNMLIQNSTSPVYHK